MEYTVFFLEDAVKDLEEIYLYIKQSGNRQAAIDMIEGIRYACVSLSDNPHRGHIPRELPHAHRFEYRQILVKKYRATAPKRLTARFKVHG